MGMARISAGILRELIDPTGKEGLIWFNPTREPHSLYDFEEWAIEQQFINQLNHIEGSAFDLRIDSIAVRDVSNKPSFIGTNNRKSHTWRKQVPRIPTDEGPAWILTPGSYLCQTMEVIHMPAGRVSPLLSAFYADLFPRVTLFENDATATFGTFPSGFSGRVKFHLRVHNEDGITLVRGARVITIAFCTHLGEAVDPYKGPRTGHETTLEGTTKAF